jgi:anti-sigma B factor antagonist
MEPPTDSFSATVSDFGGEAVVVVVGELDMATAPELARVLEPLLADGPTEIIVDFSGVSFMDSSGLAAMVRFQERLRERSRYLTVRSARPQALRVFQVIGLMEFLRVNI